MSRARRLYEPRPVEVADDMRRSPIQVEDVDVVAIREEWVVEDGWWTAEPVRRRYFELILTAGQDPPVFQSLPSGQWFAQRA